jgi:hypothetical protein
VVFLEWGSARRKAPVLGIIDAFAPELDDESVDRR